MLLEFSVNNFRSLREDQSLDLRATAAHDLPEVVRKPRGLEAGSRGVVAAAAVFGANASGKSSLFLAADFMRTAVLQSTAGAVEGAGVLQQVVPFKFDAEHRDGPVTFRVAFLLDAVRHEYGMVLQRRDDGKFVRVASEWLRVWPKGRARDVFLRGEAARQAGHADPWWVSEDGFHGGRRLAADLLEQTREDVLLLSLASQRNQPQAKVVVSWFNDQFRTDVRPPPNETEKGMVEDAHFAAYVTRLLGAADTGIQRVEVTQKEENPGSLDLYEPPSALKLNLLHSRLRPRFVTQTIHRGAAGEDVALPLTEESHGTQRLFRLAGPIYDALRHGRCLWIDELDTGMHHWLLRALIKMFQSPETNPRGAQLLFTTHDAALMDPTLFRRDQIWIVEKDAAQGSQLYSLVDFEDKPRKQQPLFKSFLSGRFGGVPRLDEAAIMNWPREGS